MKKIYLTLLFFVSVYCIHAQAVNHFIQTADFQFSPASLTVDVGDTVTWLWSNGSHTTTSTGIPAGAAPWDSPLSEASPSFSYVVTHSGVHNYKCTPHEAMGMVGSFTANSSTAIDDVENLPLLIYSIIQGNELSLNYQLNKAGAVSITLKNLNGEEISSFTSAFHSPGKYSETYQIGNFASGIYLLQLQSGSNKITRKLIAE